MIPWLLDHVARTRSRELFTLTVLVVALGIAVGSAQVFGVSMALGAFLAGMVVGRSEFSLRAASEALPMRDAFAVLFFVSVGMLLDPAVALEAPVLVAGALAVVLVGKPLAALADRLGAALSAASRADGRGRAGADRRVLVHPGGARARPGGPPAGRDQRARRGGHRLDHAQPAAVPRDWPARAVDHREALRGAGFSNAPRPVHADAPEKRPADPDHRAVVIGYGPTGRAVVDLLRDNRIEPTVVELNMDNVRSLRERGIDAVYGDATRPETLAAAGVANAGSLILGSAGMADATEVIRAARELNPKLRVLGRASYLREVGGLKNAGADAVYSGEGEVALAFVEDILEALGATPEQIERERARAHTKLGMMN